jgi:hypothetical protein
MSDLLVVVYHVAQVVATGVMRLAHAHRVVGQVDIAVVAEELRHGGVVAVARCSIWRALDNYATAMEWSWSRSRSREWCGCWDGSCLEVQSPRTQSGRACLLHFPASDREVTFTFTSLFVLP